MIETFFLIVSANEENTCIVQIRKVDVSKLLATCASGSLRIKIPFNCLHDHPTNFGLNYMQSGRFSADLESFFIIFIILKRNLTSNY